jgi:TPR repeat protein
MMLRDAAGANLPVAQEFLGQYLLKYGPREDGLRWLEIAAEGNDRDAQKYLGNAYDRGEGVAKDAERARKWYREAATSGDGASMLWMARYSGSLPQTDEVRTQTEGWLESAMYAGNQQATLELAQMYAVDSSEHPERAKAAVAMLRGLDQRHNNADARRSLAEMLVYMKTVERDPAEAERLLKIDADRGDQKSQVSLGALLARGWRGDERISEGLQLLQSLANAGNAEAMVELGYVLSRGKTPQWKDAMGFWQRAADKSNATATNNLAWALCTLPQPELLDGKRGLELARKIAEGNGAPIAYVDTLAACYATSGDFDAAERTEREAVERARTMGPSWGVFIANAGERIKLYRDHKIYIEEIAIE